MKTLIMLIAVAAVAVSTHRAYAQGCMKDTDCKGDRVCNAGVCEAAPTPPPAPVACQKDVDCSGTDLCMQNVCTAAPVSTPAPEPVAPVAPAPPPAPLPTALPPSFAASVNASPPTASTTSTTSTTTSVEVDPDANWWQHRNVFAYEFEATAGVFGAIGSSASDGYAMVGQSSAIGIYTMHNQGGALAVMVMSTFDYVNTNPTLNSYFVGGGIRYSAGGSNCSIRAGVGLAGLTDQMGDDGITGLGFSFDAVLAGKSHFGLGLDSNVAIYDGLAIVRFGIGLAITD
jgi:hypothetical protein